MKDHQFATTREYARNLEQSHAESPFPFMIFTGRLLLVWANKAFLRIFGLKEEELSSRPIDFLTLKKESGSASLSSIPREQLARFSGIVQYRQGELELNYYLSVFSVGPVERDAWFGASFTDITDVERNVLESSLHALVKASLLKDNEMGHHIRRVNRYARRLAEHLFTHLGREYPEVNPYFVERISCVAAMHDMGKIGTPDFILMKRGKLSEDEYRIIKEHTINGAFILSSLAGEMARDIALFHHEHWDGSGYPYGLKGKEIPLAARIVALTDVYDALRMTLCYKDAYEHDKAAGIIFDQRGTYFEPLLTDVFGEMSRDFERIYNELNDGKPELLEAT